MILYNKFIELCRKHLRLFEILNIILVIIVSVIMAIELFDLFDFGDWTLTILIGVMVTCVGAVAINLSIYN